LRPVSRDPASVRVLVLLLVAYYCSTLQVYTATVPTVSTFVLNTEYPVLVLYRYCINIPVRSTVDTQEILYAVGQVLSTCTSTSNTAYVPVRTYRYSVLYKYGVRVHFVSPILSSVYSTRTVRIYRYVRVPGTSITHQYTYCMGRYSPTYCSSTPCRYTRTCTGTVRIYRYVRVPVQYLYL
jgi:hypothetical protein